MGVFLVGLLADFTGVRWEIGGAAGTLLVVSLYYLIFTHRIRNLN